MVRAVANMVGVAMEGGQGAAVASVAVVTAEAAMGVVAMVAVARGPESRVAVRRAEQRGALGEVERTVPSHPRKAGCGRYTSRRLCKTPRRLHQRSPTSA